MSLAGKLVWQFVSGLFAFGLLFFLSAGSFRYWQAWAFLGVWFIPGLYFCIYFFSRDPELVRRRLHTREKVREQKWIMRGVYLVFCVAFLIPGLDFRFGWTKRRAGGIPLWLEIVSLAIVLAAYLMVIRVMDVNRYASRTIQVEEGQKVISMGPYKWVRHPFYSCSMVMFLFAPAALGSLVALPVFTLAIPFYVAC